MFKKILAAIDHDLAAATIVDSLIEVARHAAVDVIHVRRSGEQAGDASNLVLGATIRLRNAGFNAAAQVRLAAGEGTAEEVVEATAELGSDLLVLGSHGHSDVGAAIFGSVGNSTLARVDIPVLVLRGPDPSGHLHSLLTAGKVLVAIDGTERPADVVAAVTALAPWAAALVVHVRESQYAHANTAVEPREKSEAVVNEIVGALSRAGVVASASQPVGAHGVAHAIAEGARTFDADLIVVGSRRLDVVGRLLVGSVAQDVITFADRPILVMARRRPETIESGKMAGMIAAPLPGHPPSRVG